jgi:DNA helicase-2/ATP-dependent DNA helicase PcrA
MERTYEPTPAPAPSPDIRQFLATQLNPPQMDAVTHGDGPLLILAGAGSGKTRVIAYRIAYIIRERQIPPWQILAVTFTNKAARELTHRVTELTGEDQARQVRMGTFHGLCARFLRSDIELLGRRYDRNFTIYDTDDQLRVLKRQFAEAGLNPKLVSPNAVLGAIGRLKDRLVSPAQAASASESHNPFETAVATLYRRYQDALEAANAVDFGDLINLMLQLLENFPDVRQRYANRYRHVLVDEYQDVNEAQYRLVKAIAGDHRNLTVVGDDSQAIYGWRGADVRYILQFEQDFSECTTVRLEQNYRSTQTILVAAQAIEAGLTKRHAKELWTANRKGDPITGVVAGNETDEAQFVIREIDRLIGTGIAYRQIAILYRTNAQSRVLEEHLVRRRLPFQMVGGTRFYDRREIKEVIAYLHLLINPYDTDAFRRAGATRKGLGDTTIDKFVAWAAETSRPVVDGLISLLRAEALDRPAPLITQAESPDPDEKPGAERSASESGAMGHVKSRGDGAVGWVSGPLPWNRRAHELLLAYARDLDALITGLRTLSLPDLLDLLLKRTGFREYLLEHRDDNGEERWENVQELKSVVTEYGASGADEGLRLFLENAALVSDADTIRAGPRDDVVTLMTLHTAKGLEFPAVFIVGMEEGIFPHSRALEEGNIDEERRLCYVGITRAMQALYLVGCRSRSFRGMFVENDPSRFLGELPGELVRWVDGNGFRLDAARVMAMQSGAWPGHGTSRAAGSWGGGSATGSPSNLPSRPVDPNHSLSPGAPTPIRPWSGQATRVGGPPATRQASPGLSGPGTRSNRPFNGPTPTPLRPGLENIPGLRRASDLAPGIRQGQTPPAPPAPPAPPSPTYGLDERVRHPSFGDGTVIQIEPGRGTEVMIQVKFDTVGVKKLSTGLAPLTRIP